MGTGSDDAIIFESKPAHRIVVNDFGLAMLASVFVKSTSETGNLTITGGNSAVRVLDSTGCSIILSPSILGEFRLESERSRNVAWLSVRFRGKAV